MTRPISWLLRLATGAMIAVMVSGCSAARSTATITGALEIRHDDGCVYVHGPYADSTDLYLLRVLPAGYAAGSAGIDGPNGEHLRDGQAIVVVGEVESYGGGHPSICVNIHTFMEVTRISAAEQ